MPSLAAGIEPTILALGRILDRTINVDVGRAISLGRPRRSEHRKSRLNPNLAPVPPVHACRMCGIILPGESRDPYCSDCAPARPETATAGHRAAGSRVTQARRDSIRRQRLAALEWDRQNPVRPDPALFTNEILPNLDGVSYSALARASGLSRRYCKMIVTGEAVPHPMHWEAFERRI